MRTLGTSSATGGHRPTTSPRARRRPGGAEQTIETVATSIGTVALCGVLVAVAVAPDQLDRAATAIAITGILVGVPHGAVDHLVPAWQAGRRPGRPELLAVLAGYLMTAGLAVVALMVFPTPMLLLFLGVSAVHFGRGEVTFAAERAGRPTPAWSDDVAATVAHGAVVVLLPLTIWSDRSAPILAALAPGLGRSLPEPVSWFGASVVVVGVLAVAVRSVRQRRVREAAELVLVLTVFAVVPPLVAFGVYFGAWHAVRHTGRLLILPGPDGPQTAGAAFARYGRHALVPTVIALTALAVAAHTMSATAVPVAVAVLLALTFPHLRVVARLDRVAAARSA